MGCGWPGQDQTPLETLLPEHTGMNVKHIFIRITAAQSEDALVQYFDRTRAECNHNAQISTLHSFIL